VPSPPSLRGTQVLVTGAAGFIGTHLGRALGAAGASVCGLDLRPSPNGAPAPWFTADIRDIPPRALRGMRLDVVVHLAAIVGVEAAAADPAATRSVIVDGTARVLAAARHVGDPTVLYLSSSEVYGEAAALPITEDTPLRPRSPYGAAKAEAEELVAEYGRDSGAAVTVIRPFNVYGPGQRADFVVPRFVGRALAGQPLPVVSDGAQLRTFTYVDDLVHGVLAALVRRGPAGRTYNVGGADARTVADLAALVIAETGGDAHVVAGLDPAELGRPAETEIRNRVASSRRAHRELGFTPRISLRDGVREVVRAEAASRALARAE